MAERGSTRRDGNGRPVALHLQQRGSTGVSPRGVSWSVFTVTGTKERTDRQCGWSLAVEQGSKPGPKPGRGRRGNDGLAVASLKSAWAVASAKLGLWTYVVITPKGPTVHHWEGTSRHMGCLACQKELFAGLTEKHQDLMSPGHSRRLQNWPQMSLNKPAATDHKLWPPSCSRTEGN